MQLHAHTQTPKEATTRLCITTSGPAGCVLNVLVPEDLERLVLVSTSYGESLMGRHLSSAFFLELKHHVHFGMLHASVWNAGFWNSLWGTQHAHLFSRWPRTSECTLLPTPEPEPVARHCTWCLLRLTFQLLNSRLTRYDPSL